MNDQGEKDETKSSQLKLVQVVAAARKPNESVQFAQPRARLCKFARLCKLYRLARSSLELRVRGSPTGLAARQLRATPEGG